MPMRDSWPCDSASGPSLGVNSAGSWDGIIGLNSGYRGNSMEHLSAEERACLTFLEETIESLDVEDNSGVPVNKADHQPRNRLMNKMAHLSASSQVSPDVHDDPNKFSQRDLKSHKLLVPTPIVLANGNAKLLKKTDFSTAEQKPAALVNMPKGAVLNPYQFSTSQTAAESAPNPGRPNPNAHSSSEVTELPPAFIPEPPVKRNPSKAVPVKNKPPISSLEPGSDLKPKNASADLPVVLLPPPSDFMDEPMLLPVVNSLPGGQNKPQATTRLSSQPTIQFQSQPPQRESMSISPSPGFDGYIGTNNPLTSLSTSPRGQLSPNELDKLRKKASMKKAPEIVPVVPVKSGHSVSPRANSPTFGPDTSPVTGVEYDKPKSPPNVAPKLKILPSSIVLKTHKDATPGHSLVSPGDRMMINQQKVHLEALKKLGLLKTPETDSGLSSPNKTPPHTSSNTSLSVVSPAERTADPVHVSPERNALFKAQDKTQFPYLSVNPEKGERENLLAARAPSPKPFEMKSASLERSVVGLKSLTLENASWLPSQEESPENMSGSFGLVRNSGSQPASEESSKVIGIKQIPSESNREPEMRRSMPIPVPSQPESQKAVRSHGISVNISPHKTNGEDRKQALRRLGLGLINH